MPSLEGQVMDCSTHSIFLSNKGVHEDGMLGMVSVTHTLFLCPIWGTSGNFISTCQTFIEHLLSAPVLKL